MGKKPKEKNKTEKAHSIEEYGEAIPEGTKRVSKKAPSLAPTSPFKHEKKGEGEKE